MGFDEEDFQRVKDTKLIKNEVLYRQAGNSIIVNVLIGIFNYIYHIEKGDIKKMED